jgi:act minimal PKS acyl carrier protein
MMFTLKDLRELLRVDDAAELTPQNADMVFEDLGYDSLALIEFRSQLLRHAGVRMPESDLWKLRTPQQAVDYVNALRAREEKIPA